MPTKHAVGGQINLYCYDYTNCRAAKFVVFLRSFS